MIYGTVLCLGDSLTYGARSEYQRGYPEELARLLSAHFGQEWTCINAGISGETSTDILRRCFGEVRGVAALPGAKYGILVAGTNDSKNPNYPVELYEDNMRQMVRIFRRFGINLFLGTLPPVQPTPMPCFSAASNDWLKQANNAIAGFAQNGQVTCVDLRDMEPYLIDGVHFGYEGYLEMARRFFKAITSTS